MNNLYALYSTETNSIIKHYMPYPNVDESEDVILEDGLTLLKIVEGSAPDYNSCTQTLVRGESIDLSNKIVNVTWNVIDLDIPEPAFHVMPEDIYLAATRVDEIEFNKLITLLQLSLQMNQVDLSTLVKIKDFDENIHEVTVQRFLEIMVGYGFYCYQMRNL